LATVSTSGSSGMGTTIVTRLRFLVAVNAAAGENATVRRLELRRLLLGCAAPFLLMQPWIARAQDAIAVNRAESVAHLKVGGGVAYPRFSRQQGVDGQVELKMLIGTDGLVKQATAISGPKELQAACLEGVRKWQYIPFTRGGKPVEAIATTVMFFRLGKDFNPESHTGGVFRDAFQRCQKAVSDQAPAAELCERAVSLRTPLPIDVMSQAQDESGILLARAYLQAKRTQEAVAAAERAVAFITENGAPAVMTMAAYGVAGQAKGVAGNLNGSDKDLEQAEEYGQLAIAQQHKESLPQAQHLLQAMLNLHAKVLTALHRDSEAQSKLREAAKL
jgi:TonB family protein